MIYDGTGMKNRKGPLLDPALADKHCSVTNGQADEPEPQQQNSGTNSGTSAHDNISQCQTVSNSVKQCQTISDNVKWQQTPPGIANILYEGFLFWRCCRAFGTQCYKLLLCHGRTALKAMYFSSDAFASQQVFCKSSKRILKLHIDHQRLSYCSTEWEPRWPETPKRQRFSLLGWCWMRKAASSPKFGERLWENRMKQHDYTRQKGTRSISMLLPLEGKLRSCKPWCSWDPWKTQKASKSHGNWSPERLVASADTNDLFVYTHDFCQCFTWSEIVCWNHINTQEKVFSRLVWTWLDPSRPQNIVFVFSCFFVFWFRRCLNPMDYII